MDTAQLERKFGIANQVDFFTGKGGFPYIKISNEHALALISIYGGQLLSFQPQNAVQNLMFVSDNAYYQTGKAIKGGTPVCWPWFGPDPTGEGRPSHGFARNRLWQVSGAEALSTGETKIILRLNDSEDTRKLWPYAFELVLEITVGESLNLTLISHNLGDRPFELTQALHTYFSVGDIAQTTILGLDGTTYIDKVDEQQVKSQSGPLAIAAEVDRIYQSVPNELVIEDQAFNRRIRITSSGNRTAVVWNPWVELSAKSGDLTDDAYTQFVCVETTNAADDIVTVPVSGEHRLAVTYAIAALA